VSLRSGLRNIITLESVILSEVRLASRRMKSKDLRFFRVGANAAGRPLAVLQQLRIIPYSGRSRIDPKTIPLPSTPRS